MCRPTQRVSAMEKGGNAAPMTLSVLLIVPRSANERKKKIITVSVDSRMRHSRLLITKISKSSTTTHICWLR